MSDIIASAEITVTDVKDGVGIDSVVTRFLVTHLDKGVTVSTGDWSVPPPSMDVVNKYLWSYETITYTDGYKQDGKPAIIGVYGEDGVGGVTPYFHIAYANSADGTINFSVDDSSDKEYIGQYTSYARTGQGRNLVIRYNEIVDKQLDGAGNIGNGIGHSVMDGYISVVPDEVLTFSMILSELQTTSWWRFSWLDSEENFISRTAISATDEPIFQWTVPNNAHFIQVSYPTDSYPQIERGNTATDWTEAPEDAMKDSTNPEDYSWTKIKGEKGDTGDDGKDAISAVLTNESITFAANKDGVVQNQNYVGNTGNFLLMEGTVNKSAETDFKIVNQTNVSAAINTSGFYTISSMEDKKLDGTLVTTGQVTFSATYKETTIDKTVTISKSIAGQTGAPATSYWLTSSVDTITVKYNGDYDPKTITYYGHSKTGSNNTQNYAGRFIIQTSIDGVNFTETYRTQSDENKVDFSVPEDSLFIKAKFYQAGGTTYLLDEQTTPILHSADGLKGVGLDDKDYQVGTEVFTDKADDSVVHVEIDGKSYQHAGSGKNLFSVKDYVELEKDLSASNTYSLTSDNKLQVNRTDSRGTQIDLYSYILNIKENTDYTYSVDTEMNWRINIYDTDGNLVLNSTNIKGKKATFNSGSGGVQLTTKFFPVESDHPIVVGDIQLEEGTSVTEYELPAPTPDYPIEVHSLNDFDVVSQKSEGGTIDGIEVGGRNYLRNSKERILESEDNNFNYALLLYPTVEGQTYTISADVDITDGEFSVISVLVNYNRSNSSNVHVPIVGGRITRTYTAYDTVEHNVVLLYAGSSSATRGNGVIFRNIKIEKGSTSTDWTPAPEDITKNDNHPLIDKINLSLREPLRSVGGVKDRLYRDTDGLWKVERNVGELVADGSENWWLSPLGWQQSNNTISFTITIGKGYVWDKFPKEELVSNLFMSFQNIHEGIIITGHDFEFVTSDNLSGHKRFNVLKSRLKTQDLNGWKDFLTKKELEGTPLKLLYAVESPTIETLDQELQDKLNNLRSFQYSNYVYTIINDKADIISEKLKPTLRLTFKGGGYYARWKTTYDLEKTTEYIEQEIKRTQNTAWIRAGMRVGYSSFTQANPNSVYICGLEHRDGYRDMVLVDKPAEIYIRESNETTLIPNKSLSASGIPDGVTAYIIWDNTDKSLFLAYLESEMTATGVSKKRWRNNTSGKTITFTDSLFAIGEIEV